MKWLIAGALLVGAAILAVIVASPGAAVRYRLTLYATVDGEQKVGSTVVEVRYHKNPKLLPNEAEFSSIVNGEALVLDLGKPGLLFALLREGSDPRSAPEWIILRAFGFAGGSMPCPIEQGIAQIRKLSGKVELPLDNLPMLVRFRDSADLRTAERVNPRNTGEHFGADTRLVRATLEIVPAGIWPFNRYGITGEPLTNGIESKLSWWNGPFPWLKPMGNGVFVDTRTEAFKVNKEDFKKG